MHTAFPLVLFSLGRQRLALPLAVVRRVVRAVEVTPVPAAPAVVCGVVDVQGEVIAVLDVRSRFGLPRRPIAVTDQLLIAQMRDRTVALLVDQVHGMAQAGEHAVLSHAHAPWFEQFHGLAQLGDGLVLIQDLEKFLAPAEARALDECMAGAR